jgi:hypothetical protein
MRGGPGRQTSAAPELPEEGEKMEDRERLTVVLKHLVEHNEGHGEDYERWIDLARHAGLEDVAKKIGQAHEHVDRASDALKAALDLIKE